MVAQAACLSCQGKQSTSSSSSLLLSLSWRSLFLLMGMSVVDPINKRGGLLQLQAVREEGSGAVVIMAYHGGLGGMDGKMPWLKVLGGWEAHRISTREYLENGKRICA